MSTRRFDHNLKLNLLVVFWISLSLTVPLVEGLGYLGPGFLGKAFLQPLLSFAATGISESGTEHLSFFLLFVRFSAVLHCIV